MLKGMAYGDDMKGKAKTEMDMSAGNECWKMVIVLRNFEL